ncbi:helix-hairpin-helix domain-containing protein [Streptomyces sp. GbtcB6]|uniref:helix-hairpin-helix domain-containing protein n=1 Tax=Streptomyces sp. GbtcB6 TaxID=2824751 RepID=UPI001C2F1710|nr:helix-hairpin-helix domain-containing protein [Streptomyces sp. GbtcB6]
MTEELTRIDGVGASTARRLAAAGIRTCAELSAASTDEVLAAVHDLHGMSVSRAERWRKNAAELAAAEAGLEPEPEPADGEEYESFVLRVRLDRGRVRATEIRRVRTGETRHWPEWDAQALLACVLGRPAPPEADAQPEPEAAGGGEPGARPAPPTVVPAEPRLAVGDGGTVRAGAPFALDVTVELPPSGGPEQCFAYYAAVTETLTGAGRRMLAEGRGVVVAGHPVIRLPLPGLPPGTHSLGIAVSLREPGGLRPSALAATVNGLVLSL